MDLDRTHGLAFLLSLAALPMAGCPAATEDTTTGTGDTTGDSQTSDPSTDPSTVSITSADTTDASMSMGTTVEPTTDPSTDPTTLTDPTDPTDATTEGTATDPTDATTSAEETTTDPSTDEGTTGPVDSVCSDFADQIVECFPKYAGGEDYLSGYCNDTLQYYGAYSPECGTAAEEYFACLAMADCGDLAAETACPDEAAALAAACGDIGSTSSGGN